MTHSFLAPITLSLSRQSIFLVLQIPFRYYVFHLLGCFVLFIESIRPLPVGELGLIDAVLVGMVGVLDNLVF